LHLLESGLVEHSLRFGRQRTVDRHVVRDRQQLVQLHPLDTEVLKTSGGTYGSNAITRIPNAFALGATSCGMRPKPTNPKTLPRSRWIGTKFGIFHVPRCTSSVAFGILRTADNSSAIA